MHTEADSAIRQLPGVVDFHRFNSAQRSLELPVDWVRVRQIAFQLERLPDVDEPMQLSVDSSEHICSARVRGKRMPDDGGPGREKSGFELEVADKASLEVGKHVHAVSKSLNSFLQCARSAIASAKLIGPRDRTIFLSPVHPRP